MHHPPDIWTPQRGYANTMIPADRGANLTELVRIALYNIDQWDEVPRSDELNENVKKTLDPQTHREHFEAGLARIAAKQGWTIPQCQDVKKLKYDCPPNRLYRIRGGFESGTRGLAPVGLILSYRPGKNGGPAEAGVMVLGADGDHSGSASRPIAVPAEGLEDVTDFARAGKLTETHDRG